MHDLGQAPTPTLMREPSDRDENIQSVPGRWGGGERHVGNRRGREEREGEDSEREEREESEGARKREIASEVLLDRWMEEDIVVVVVVVVIA